LSGEGAAIAPRMQHAHLRTPHWDPTNGLEGACADAANEAAAAERLLVVEHVRRKIEVAKRHDSDGHLVRVLDELAEDIGRGLHRA
jgi:hypothetical protein